MAERESNRRKENTARQGVPVEDLEQFARFLLPKIQAFYETEEGQRAFQEWKKTEVDKNCGRASLRYPAVVYILKRIRRKDDIENRICGYIRVSTREQNEGRQVIALHEAGVDTRYIYMNKQSGKNFERPQYKKMLRKMRSGDLLYAKSIEQLGAQL